MKQVITTHDWFLAMSDYLIEQMDGRIRLEYSEFADVLDCIIEDLKDPLVRSFELDMIEKINHHVFQICAVRTECALSGCPKRHNHKFLEELVNLFWNSHHEAEQWLARQGIIPGHSTN